jgi:hypothetical protein
MDIHPHQRLTARVFTFINGLAKPGKSSLYQVSLRICIISVFRETVLKCMFKYIELPYEINKVKTISRLADTADLNFIDSKIKCNIR